MALVGGGSAQAEVGAGADATSQAIAADAQFLEYAPPPLHPGVVCLVDSGVDPNPDTNAAVIGAEARDPNWGTGDGLAQTQPRVDGHPAGHGTQMAMLMAAPQNGWGMVGIAPTSVRVYSIRVVPPGQGSIPFANYSYA
ncbi:MAG: Subtilase family, partial [Solirubrobacteraceae bacterium]|nr:Subtilase family [Solirubrobacteraceae bacterium]